LVKYAYFKNKFYDFLVTGWKGGGKTTYGLATAREVYEDWDVAFEHLYFDVDEALKRIKEAVLKGERVPLIVHDDAGLDLYHLTWYEKKKVKYGRFYNVVRQGVAGVIYTSPIANIIKSVRSQIVFRVEIQDPTPWENPDLLPIWEFVSKASLEDLKKKYESEYKSQDYVEEGTAIIKEQKRQRKNDQIYFKIVAKDKFKVRIPNKIYREYDKLKSEATLSAIEEIEGDGKKKDDEKIEKTVVNSNIPIDEIVKSVISLALNGNTRKIVELALPHKTFMAFVRQNMDKSAKDRYLQKWRNELVDIMAERLQKIFSNPKRSDVQKIVFNVTKALEEQGVV
jgi:hypothetical protein